MNNSINNSVIYNKKEKKEQLKSLFYGVISSYSNFIPRSYHYSQYDESGGDSDTLPKIERFLFFTSLSYDEIEKFLKYLRRKNKYLKVFNGHLFRIIRQKRAIKKLNNYFSVSDTTIKIRYTESLCDNLRTLFIIVIKKYFNAKSHSLSLTEILKIFDRHCELHCLYSPFIEDPRLIWLQLLCNQGTNLSEQFFVVEQIFLNSKIFNENQYNLACRIVLHNSENLRTGNLEGVATELKLTVKELFYKYKDVMPLDALIKYYDPIYEIPSKDLEDAIIKSMKKKYAKIIGIPEENVAIKQKEDYEKFEDIINPLKLLAETEKYDKIDIIHEKNS